MIKHNQDGSLNVLLLPLILASVFLIGAISFGAWAFSERQTYKNDTDQIVAEAVVKGKQEEAASKDKQYAEAAKLPLKTYNGPEQFGSIVLQFPKTWSAYVSAGTESDADLNGYFHPDVVPDLTDEASSFALRVEVVSEVYSEVVSDIEDLENVTITPYALPKLSKVIGIRIDGQIEENKRGSMIILPVRDKTLKVYTESETFLDDFNNNILANLTFSP